MRSNVHLFIEKAKASALATPKNQVTEGLFLSEGAKSTIFNQVNYISLNKMELQQVREAIVCLDKACELIVSAMGALNEFKHLDLNALQLSGNFARGTSYMLEEFLTQQKGVSAKVCDFATRGVAR